MYRLQNRVRTQADGPIHSLELEFILPENILQAVAYVDTFYVDSVTTPADSQKQCVSLLGHCILSPCNATSGSGASSLPDVVPNTMTVEPSFAPPMDVHPTRKALNPAHTTSKPPPPVAVPTSGEAPRQTAEAPLPHRVRDTTSVRLLYSMVPSYHPGEQQNAQQRPWNSETMR